MVNRWGAAGGVDAALSIIVPMKAVVWMCSSVNRLHSAPSLSCDLGQVT